MITLPRAGVAELNQRARRSSRNERERSFMRTTPTQGATMPVIAASARSDANIKGADYGASISLILDESEPGQGPRLHRHPYDETWVVQEGHLTFQYGEEQLACTAGDVVIVPPGVPHKFTNDGPGRSKLVCIHASPTFIGEWLE